MDHAIVTRSVRLDAEPLDAWASLSTADGLAGWLGDVLAHEGVDGRGALQVGSSALVEDAGTVRRLVVTSVDDGRSLGFTWWSEDAPEQASTVMVALDDAEGEGTVVTVTERLAGAAVAQCFDAVVADLGTDAEHAWDRRLRALLGQPVRV